jgi:CHAD domain-containing protein
VSRRETIWQIQRKALRRAEKKFRRGDPEGLHDFRVALRRVAVIAEAGQRPKIARDATKLVRRFSPLRQLEVDRELVAALVRSGEIAPADAQTVNDLFADRLHRGRGEALDRLDAATAKSLFERLGHDRRNGPVVSRLGRENDDLRAPRMLDDEGLHRLRIAVKRRRYALMARRELGVAGLEAEIAKWQTLQDALGRANDWRSLLRDLVRLIESQGADREAESPIDRIFDRASDRAEEARRAARAAVAASGLVADPEPALGRPRPAPRREPARAGGSASLLRGAAALSRLDS